VLAQKGSAPRRCSSMAGGLPVSSTLPCTEPVGPVGAFGAALSVAGVGATFAEAGGAAGGSFFSSQPEQVRSDTTDKDGRRRRRVIEVSGREDGAISHATQRRPSINAPISHCQASARRCMFSRSAHIEVEGASGG